MSSSSSSSSSSSLSGLRLSGTSLLSGLDTESIVKQMASGTKSKINKQQQKVDKLSWKQENYRTIATKISEFRDTYFNSLKPATNISSRSLMAKCKSTTSNASVVVNATSSASAATYTISNIQQLAEKANVTSDFGTGGKLSDGINLDFSAAVSGTTYNLKFNLDGASKDVTFTAGADAATTAANLQTALGTAFGAAGANFSVTDETIKYTLSDGVTHTFSITSSSLDQVLKSDGTADSKATATKKAASLNSIGLPDGGSSKVSTTTKLSDINFTTPLVGGSYSFSINGKEFTFDSSASVKDIISEVNADSTANVTLSFDSLAQTFSLKSDDEGAASTISVKQTSGNLLTSMFGSQVIAGNKLGSTTLISRTVAVGSALAASTDLTDNKNSYMEVTVNGVTKTIGLYGYDNNGNKYDYTTTTVKDSDGNETTTTGAEKAVAALNTDLTRQFGDDAPSFVYDKTTRQITLSGDKLGDVVKINAVASSTGSTALLAKLGLSGTSTNAVTSDSKLSTLLGSNFTAGSLTIGTSTYSIDANTTLGDIATNFGSNVTIDYANGVINANAQITASDANGQKLVEALFKGDYADVNGYSGTASGAASSTEVTKAGKNAIVTINGTTITNSSNNLSIDGTSINIGGLTAAQVSSVATTPITITTAKDNTDAKAAVLKFVDAYNALIDELYNAIETKRPTSDGTASGTKYEPLTEEQREDMSEDEITAWEKKAKTGLLYADSTITSITSDLREALNTRMPSGFSLYNMGIEVSSTMSDNGKLSMADQSVFEASFEKYADEIQDFFTNTTNGLSTAITKAIDSAVSTSRTDGYGSLVRLAGMSSTVSDSDNEITSQITAYQKTIKTLKTKYSNEMERYWSKFTTLETTMSKYNSYSSMFSSSTS